MLPSSIWWVSPMLYKQPLTPSLPALQFLSSPLQCFHPLPSHPHPLFQNSSSATENTRQLPMDQLLKCPANYVPLSPVTFLSRAAAVYPDRTSIVYERTRFTWKQTNDRCLRMASSLRSLNVSKNDVVGIFNHLYCSVAYLFSDNKLAFHSITGICARPQYSSHV